MRGKRNFDSHSDDLWISKACHLYIVATHFWIWNLRTFQDFQQHFRQISRSCSIKIPGYSRTKIIFGPIFKDGDKQIQGHYGRTRCRVNDSDRRKFGCLQIKGFRIIWFQDDCINWHHHLPTLSNPSRKSLRERSKSRGGGWIISFDFRIIVLTDTTPSLRSAILAETH